MSIGLRHIGNGLAHVLVICELVAWKAWAAYDTQRKIRTTRQQWQAHLWVQAEHQLRPMFRLPYRPTDVEIHLGLILDWLGRSW